MNATAYQDLQAQTVRMTLDLVQMAILVRTMAHVITLERDTLAPASLDLQE